MIRKDRGAKDRHHLGDHRVIAFLEGGAGKAADLIAAQRVSQIVDQAFVAITAFADRPGAIGAAQDMGQAVIGGVITSSLLTLVVVPVMYCYMDDLAQWARRVLAGKGQCRPRIDGLS